MFNQIPLKKPQYKKYFAACQNNRNNMVMLNYLKRVIKTSILHLFHVTFNLQFYIFTCGRPLSTVFVK